jgi:hypothetical protein
MTRKIVGLHYSANDRKGGITFGELAEFVEACRRVGVADDARVNQRATWRLGIRELSVQTVSDDETPAEPARASRWDWIRNPGGPDGQ